MERVKKSIKLNIDRRIENSFDFESDGKLIIFLNFLFTIGSLVFPDCDDYSDLEIYNQKISEFAEKKREYNNKKKINNSLICLNYN